MIFVSLCAETLARRRRLPRVAPCMPPPIKAFRLIVAFAALVATAGLVTTAGRAQDVGHIAAVVNDEVISVYDLNARTRVIMSSTRLPDNAETRRRLVPQILRSLIDEKLQLQEAKRLNIGVTNEELADAFRTIEKQNGMPAGRLKDAVESAGIPFSTIESQTRAALAWGKVVRRQIRNLVQVGPEEVQDEIARLEAARNRPQSLTSEIFLSVDSINQEDEVRNAAIRLAEQVRGGAAFEAMARQFSQSATAANGGDLGWVVPGTMPEELDSALARLQPGQITDPIRSVAGYHILLLRDRQIRGTPGTDDTTVGLQYVFIRLPQNPTAEDRENLTSLAKLVRENAQDCADMTKLRSEVGGAQFPLPERAKMKDLSEALRAVVTSLDVGKASEPLPVANGVLVLMVCSKDKDEGLNPEDVEAQLLEDKIEIQARRYMRDLRRAAFIDIRV